MRIGISSSLLDTILAAARADPAREICGLLFGTPARIEAWQPAANVSPTPSTRFEIDPTTLFAAQRRERSGGPMRIGHVHSHPSGDTRPSARDAAMADEEAQLWLIVAGAKAECWIACADGAFRGRFDPVALDIAPPLASIKPLRQSDDEDNGN